MSVKMSIGCEECIRKDGEYTTLVEAFQKIQRQSIDLQNVNYDLKAEKDELGIKNINLKSEVEHLTALINQIHQDTRSIL